jgi:acetyl esterase/lipase
MSDAAAPADPPPRHLRDRILDRASSLCLQASLRVDPRPAVGLYRRRFAAGARRGTRRLAPHAPAGVTAIRDLAYGPGPDELLDIHRPAASDAPLPVFVWVHGGGWFGGAKEDYAPWFALVAGHGYAVVVPRYSLSPAHRYPTPVRQIMQALAHVQVHAQRLGLDPGRIALGGDSAGGQMAAQVGAIVTTPGYANAVGVEPTITSQRLRGLVLACGFYDLSLAASVPGDFRRLLSLELWSYSGHRDFMRDPLFATMSVAGHVTADFPPALVSAGNADLLAPQSHLLVERLRAAGAAPETLFFAPAHQPPVDHEYQFDLDTDAGRAFLDRMLRFLDERLGSRRRDPPG